MNRNYRIDNILIICMIILAICMSIAMLSVSYLSIHVSMQPTQAVDQGSYEVNICTDNKTD